MFHDTDSLNQQVSQRPALELDFAEHVENLAANGLVGLLPLLKPRVWLSEQAREELVKTLADLLLEALGEEIDEKANEQGGSMNPKLSIDAASRIVL